MSMATWKRWVAGICASAIVAGVPAMGAYAMGGNPTTSMDGQNRTGTTKIVINVEAAAADTPTYIVTIPEKVDFGTVQQPSTAGEDYEVQSINVGCSQLTNLKLGQRVLVRVKDSTATSKDDPFKVVNGKNEVLNYDIVNIEGDANIRNANTWTDNGYLIASFAYSNQGETFRLKLDKGQLYGKDMAEYGGEYTGSLLFNTSVATA